VGGDVRGIVYSRHAARRMQLYEISRQDVAEVLSTPDTEEPSIKSRVNATRSIAGRRVRVTYVDEPIGRVIITVTPLDISGEDA
jgi:hypothetical protein